MNPLDVNLVESYYGDYKCADHVTTKESHSPSYHVIRPTNVVVVTLPFQLCGHPSIHTTMYIYMYLRWDGLIQAVII